MPRLALLAPALLAACAAQPPPVRGEMPGRICQTGGTDQFIGRAGTSETGAAILRVSHASILRWAPPGVMLTMDFSPSRVTVRLGPDGKITAINCG
jgi:hypothetical protein